MKSTIAVSLLTLLFASVAHADDAEEEKRKAPERLEIAELAPDLDGAEVFMTFKVASTYRISGGVPKGRVPTFGIKVATKDSEPPFSVRVSGNVADAMKRFGYHPLRGGKMANGLTIEACGRLKLYGAPRDAPEKEVSYVLQIADLDSFRVVSFPTETNGTTASPEPRATYLSYNGDWEIANDMDRVLRHKALDRDSVTFAIPSSFSLSLQQKVDENANNDEANSLLVKAGHKLSASGQWTADADEMGFEPDRCVVSTRGGQTFLWFTDVPFVAHYGGTVSYVEGADRTRDLLVIVFNTTPVHGQKDSQPSSLKRGQNTVVYRRKKR